MMTRKLFAAFVGGEVSGCHVELHDVRFVIGECIEDCFDDLRRQWWGEPESLHLDAWGAIEWADGHAISIADRADNGVQKLWFFNLGGYDPSVFAELHKNVFLVGPDWRSAKVRAVEQIGDWVSPHKDYAIAIDKAIDVAAVCGGVGEICLTRCKEPRPFSFEARFLPIGKTK